MLTLSQKWGQIIKVSRPVSSKSKLRKFISFTGTLSGHIFPDIPKYREIPVLRDIVGNLKSRPSILSIVISTFRKRVHSIIIFPNKQSYFHFLLPFTRLDNVIKYQHTIQKINNMHRKLKLLQKKYVN